MKTKDGFNNSLKSLNKSHWTEPIKKSKFSFKNRHEKLLFYSYVFKLFNSFRNISINVYTGNMKTKPGQRRN